MIREWVTRHKIATVIALFVIGAVIAALMLLAPLIAAIAAVVVLPALGFLFANLQYAEKWGGRVVELFSFASQTAERVGISAEMQGVINGARDRLEDELPDIMPAPVRVKFVRNQEDLATLRDGEVVISLQNPKRRAENTARATLGYVSTVTIRPARAYVGTEIMAGVDYSITKRILLEADKAALDYFLNQIWAPAMQEHSGLKEICGQVERVERHGLLARILLAEYLDLGRRLYGSFPSDQVRIAARDFLAHLATIAARETDEHVPLDFSREGIHVSVILVGERERVEREGVRPYVRACETAIQRGATTIYLLGRGTRRDLVQQVTEAMELNGRVLATDLSDYFEERDDGRISAVCARIDVQSGGRIPR